MSRSRSKSPRSKTRRGRSRSPRQRSRDRSRSGERKVRTRSKDCRDVQRRSRSRDRRDARRRSRSRSRGRRDAHRRSRSRSRSRERKETRPKTRSRSREVEKSKADATRKKSGSRSSSPLTIAKLQAELDSRVKDFIDQDKIMFTELSAEKNRFRDEPESHPDYTEEWRRFYNDQCFIARAKVNPSLLKAKWAAEWDAVLNDVYLRKLTRMREQMMDRLRVNKDDIEDYLMRQKAAAAEKPKIPSTLVSSEEHFHDRLQPSRIDSDDLPANPSHPQSVASSRDNFNTGPEQRSDSDVTVMNTLRLLSAIEHLLDELGFQIIQSLGRANAMEVNMGAGQSVKMLEDKPFFGLLTETQKRLQARLVDPKVPERSLNVIRICIDQITILLQQSSCIATSSQPESDPDASLKEAIATTIRDEYARSGVHLTQDQVDILVKKQMERIREERSKPARPSESSNSRLPGGGQDRNNSSSVGAPSASIQFHVEQERIESEPEPNIVSIKSEPVQDYRREDGQQTSMDGNESDGFDDFTISELISLLKNFQKLDKDHQTSLILYMKKLEVINPEKVYFIKNSM